MGMSRTPLPDTAADRATDAPDACAAPAAPAPGWDVNRRFIRVVQEHGNGMVEFEFAVGEPGLFVEMVMPRAQFEDFCAQQGVAPTRGRLPEHEQGSDAHEWDWRLRDARGRHFRHEETRSPDGQHAPDVPGVPEAPD